MLDLYQYKLIVESSPNLVWRADLSTRCDYFNKTWLSFTGRAMDQELGTGWTTGIHPDDFPGFMQTFQKHFYLREPFDTNYRLKRHDGVYRWINNRGVPIYDEQDVFHGYIGICMDVTEKVEGQLLKDMAHHDGLSRLFSRQYAFQLLAVAYKAVSPDMPMTMLMMDIDNFKDVNDTYGHQMGDRVLEYVASVIKRAAGDRGIAGRYGGDEFIIGMPNMKSDDAARIAAAIMETVHAHEFDMSGRLFHISMSAGIAETGGERTLEELVYMADANLYRAKYDGKNCIRIEPVAESI